MRVHLIKKQTVEDFVLNNVSSKSSFEGWLSVIKKVDWSKPNDIISTFNTADILGKGSNRVIFNIAGNNYRIICKYHFGRSSVHLFVKWIGTHKDYDKICENNLQYTINKY